ncbi:MAG TPA: PAS domain S-box protein [Polyangiaceae bacterium]|nr:PAS domain S-box protein [Polyangiaceae bacterium]
MQALVELTRFLAKTQDIRDALHAVVSCAAEVVAADACLVVLAESGESHGHLAAISSRMLDARGTSRSIELSAYPEITQVLHTGESLVLEGFDAERFLVKQSDAAAGAPSCLAVVPIGYDGGRHGVLYVQLVGQTSLDAAARVQLELVANATAMALRNAQMTESLLYEKQQITEQRARVEHRMRFFQRYADFFESAADGMIVVDHQGRILFSNPRASEITGYSPSEISNASVLGFLTRKEVARTADLVRGFRAGVYPRGVDIRFIPKAARESRAGKALTLNVTFSPVLRAERAVLCAFRDVTVERTTEIELRRTTQFLERVIDSSVDAIVSSDMSGRVLIFNRAAARIFGYEPADVVGRLSVERLYPEGVAREVMRKIRSPEHGGPYRLEDYRVDMMGSRGETIPVNISAALIMDNDKPIGSVGIFTDVREKLRMEARLSSAQAELREQEKGLALAELAGTTAHELNQPLTGVIGYAELLMRQLAAESPLYGAAEVILSESQRMAGIVRKIGKITRYETRSYLGGTKILDLDKAAPESADPRGPDSEEG